MVKHSTSRSPLTVLVDNFFGHRAGDGVRVEVVPHLGLMTLATILLGQGHRAEIFDPKLLYLDEGWTEPAPEFLDAWADALLRREAQVIGFTAYGRSLPYAVRVAERIKRESPGQAILLGGPHASIVGERILAEFPCFDAVVRYEAERLILPLVEALACGGSLAEVPNLVYRQGDAVRSTRRLTELPEMDDLPRPALDLYPLDRLRATELSIEAGRGCPFTCTFCSTSGFFQRRYRLKSNARMVDEMEDARRRYGIERINLNHDLFGLNRRSLREFCSVVQGRGFRWKCSMRPDTLDPALIRDLAAAGCEHIYFGIETGSPRLQDVIRKSLRLEKARSTVADVVAEGMGCTVSFITGFPEEGPDDQDQTLDLIGELLRIDPARVLPQLHILSPEPGSPLSETERPIGFDGIGPEADEFVDEELVRAHPEVFSVFYHYRSATPRRRNLLASAFVTYVLPELGYPLAVYLCDCLADGRLSRLFRMVLPQAPDSDSPLDYANILRILHDGIDALLARHSSGRPELGELVRFSRILACLKGSGPRDAESPPGPGSGPEIMWLARFGCDIVSLVRCIIQRGHGEAHVEVSTDGESWLLFRPGGSPQNSIVPVHPDVGRELAHLGRAHPLAPALEAGSIHDLGVTLVEY